MKKQLSKESAIQVTRSNGLGSLLIYLSHTQRASWHGDGEGRDRRNKVVWGQ